MPKSHVVKLKIHNVTDEVMNYKSDWFDSGRLADGLSWPATISPGITERVECHEKEDSTPAGCSGYVIYTLGTGEVTIAFSNLSGGSNKLGVGVDSHRVWKKMNSHDYEEFIVGFKVGKDKFLAHCQCTSGDVNDASLTLE